MVSKAQSNNVDFRPHFKTHQSLEIGRWFKELGVKKITVSSLEMAEYFAEEWNDITVAFPANILEIETINQLASKIRLNLLVESVEVAKYLSGNLSAKVRVFIKIDTGYHRTGIAADNSKQIDEILSVIGDFELLEFEGFLAHAGHSYKARSADEILEVHEQSVSSIVSLRDKYIESYPNLIISIGDTPTCSVADDFSAVDEIRPGNFVFFDLAQNQIGSCDVSQIAVAMACPIVAVHEDRNELVIYGGGVHFSKENLEDDTVGIIYGKVVESNENGTWGKVIPDMYINSLSQEHGIVSVPKSQLSGYTIGDYLLILPVHSCMTANLMKRYETGNLKTISRL